MTMTENTVLELTELWSMLLPKGSLPSTQQWAIWLLRYDHRIVRQGIAQLGLKYGKTSPAMDFEYMQKYASSMMGSLHNQTAARLGAEHHRSNN